MLAYNFCAAFLCDSPSSLPFALNSVFRCKATNHKNPSVYSNFIYPFNTLKAQWLLSLYRVLTLKAMHLCTQGVLVCVSYHFYSKELLFLDDLSPEYWTERLCRNVGNRLQIYATWNSRRARVSFIQGQKPETTQGTIFLP